MRIGLGILCLFWSLLASAASSSCGWVALANGARLIGLDRLGSPVSLPASPRLTMNAADCGVWATVGATLYRIGEGGAVSQTIDLSGLASGFGAVQAMAADSVDQSLWLTDGSRLLRVDAQGRRLLAVSAPGIALRMAVGPDQHLWLLGNNTLWRINDAGQTLAATNLSTLLTSGARFLALDTVGRRVWVADNTTLIQFDFSQLGQPRRVFASGTIRALAVEPISGATLVLHDDGVAPYSRDLKPLPRLALTLPGAALDLAYDARDPGWWLAGKDGLIRFTLAGQVQSRLGGLGSLAALALPVVAITPTLNLLQPSPDGLGNDPRLALALVVGALCQGQPCNLGDSYTSGLLTATLDQKSINFAAADSAGVRRYTPEAPLAEGSHRITAQFTDPWGKRQAQVAATFSLDLTPPQFVSLEPADGSSSAQARITLRGKVDDAEAYVTLTDYEAYALKGEHPAKQSFVWDVTLQPGPNTLQLVAMDKAGNKTQKTLRLTLTGVAPALNVTITSPGNSTAVDDDRIRVTGRILGSAEAAINVNGVLAARDGSNWWADNVPLRTGLNFVRATATDQSGQTAVAMINVLSSGPAPIQLIATPTNGLPPLTVRFYALGINGIQELRVKAHDHASTQKTDNPDEGVSHTYPSSGTYAATVSATDGKGNSTEKTLTINVHPVDQLDKTLRGIFSSMIENLKSGNLEAATQYIAGTSREKYRELFRQLIPALKDERVFKRIGYLHDGKFGDGFAEYLLLRDTPTGLQGFYIYFLKSEDGVWRIESM